MAKKKSIEDYFNYTQPDIDVPEWFKPTAKTKADSLPQTPMMSLLSAVIGPEEYEKEMGRQAARKKSWDQFEKEEFQRSGSKPIGLTTGTPAVDYYNNNPKPAPTYPLSRVIDHDAVDTGPAQYATMESAPVPVWQAPAEDYYDFSKRPPATYGSSVVVGRDDTRGMSEQVEAPQGVAFPTWVSPNQVNAPDMYQQAVGLDGKEPAATVASNGFIPMPAPQGNILTDSSGAPVMSGGSAVGLPNQGPGADPGGKGGALTKQVQTQAPGRGSESGGK